MSEFAISPEIKEEDALVYLVQSEITTLVTSSVTNKLRVGELFAGPPSIELNEYDESLSGIFPANLAYSRSRRSINMRHSTAAFDEICRDYEVDEPVSRHELLRLYIGAALINLAFAQRLKPEKAINDELFTIMTSPQGLFRGAMDERLTDEETGFETMKAIITGDEERLARINGLRLSIGTYITTRPVGSGSENIIKNIFLPQLRDLLRSRESYMRAVQLFLPQKIDEETTVQKTKSNRGMQEDKRAEKMYIDHLSNIIIAGALPMGREEIGLVLNLY